MWPRQFEQQPEKRGPCQFMSLTSGDVRLALGTAGTRSTNDSTRSLSISWSCFLLYRLCPQENFFCMIVKMPLIILYYPSSLLIPEKKQHESIPLLWWPSAGGSPSLSWLRSHGHSQSIRQDQGDRGHQSYLDHLSPSGTRVWSQPCSNYITET